MCSRWRVVLARFVYNTTIWFSIAVGILPFGYNTKLQEILPSKCALIYSVCVNALMIAISIFVWRYVDALDFEPAHHHELIDVFGRVIIISNICTLVIIVVKNWCEYKSVLNIFNEFAAIKRAYYAKHIALARKCTNYEDYIIWKGLATLLQNLSFLYTIFGNAVEIDWHVVVILFFILLLGNVIFLVVLNFYLFVLTTYRCMWLLQQRLECIAVYIHQCPQNIRGAKNELYEIIGIYLRLLKLCERFGRIYDHQLLISTVAIMSGNILTLFYLRIIWSEKLAELPFWDIFYTLQAVLINVFDFWLTIAVCEMALGAARDIARHLRGFNTIVEVYTELGRPLEILAGVCGSHMPEFRLCGLVDINHLTGCKALLTMILYLIYLVQFSYKDF